MTRVRPRKRGLRELGLVVPDPRVRKRVASQVFRLNGDNKDDALRWIESVSEFDVRDPSER
jgi:hypothetical protein